MIRSVSKSITLFCLSCTVAVVLLGLPRGSSSLTKEADAPRCSGATLKGLYGTGWLGSTLFDRSGSPGHFPASSVGIARLDGKGRITVLRDSLNDNGQVFERDFVAGIITFTDQQGQRQTIQLPPLNFEYKVAPDCRGTVIISALDGTVLIEVPFVAVNGGREVLFHQTIAPQGVPGITNPIVLLGTAKMVGRD